MQSIQHGDKLENFPVKSSQQNNCGHKHAAENVPCGGFDQVITSIDYKS